jgi:hypothetical protein
MLIDKLIEQVAKLQLDLSGRTVLTEAASGAYVVTPVLAALAGAKVLAYSRTTRYGTVADVFDHTRRVIGTCKARSLDVSLIDELRPEHFAQADVITNSGHLRPLDQDKLQHARDEVVISMMYEAWEWRSADMDIEYIRSRGFRVGAINERHPDIDVFGYLGDMAVRQILDAGVCLYGNRFVLLCNNEFGPYIARVLKKMCSGLAVIDLDENKHRYDLEAIDWIGGFPQVRVPAQYRNAQAVVFTAYPFNQSWIGDCGEISTWQIRGQFANPFVIRFAGDVDEASLIQAGISYYPSSVPSGHMGILPSDIGVDPIIRLQSGGLKVAECILSGRHEYKGVPIVEVF